MKQTKPKKILPTLSVVQQENGRIGDAHKEFEGVPIGIASEPVKYGRFHHVQVGRGVPELAVVVDLKKSKGKAEDKTKKIYEHGP